MKGRDTNALTVTAARAERYPHPDDKMKGVPLWITKI